MNWTLEDPSEGDADGAYRMAYALAERRDAAGTALYQFDFIISATLWAWQGDGGDAWRARIESLKQELRGAYNTADALHAAYNRYAGEFSEIRDSARSWRFRHRSAIAELEQLDRAAAAFIGPPGPELTGLWDRRRADYEDDRDLARRFLDELGQRRLAAETRLVNEVCAATPARWTNARAAAITIGITDPAQMTPQGFANWAELAGTDAVLDSLNGMSPAQVAALWALLPRTVVDSLIAKHPESIGNLEGVAYTDRSLANVSRLDGLLAGAEDEYEQLVAHAAQGPGALFARALGEALAKRDALRVLAKRYADGSAAAADPPEFLISLDTTGPGEPLAAVSVGNLDTSLNATFLVPGMNSGVNELKDHIRSVRRIQGDIANSAVVLWFGYNSPKLLKDGHSPVTEVLDDDKAQAGGRQLRDALNGFDARNTASGKNARFNLLAHSYGTTASAYALAGGVRGIDSVTFLGSAGIPKSIRLKDFHLPEHSVFVTEADADHLADIGRGLEYDWTKPWPNGNLGDGFVPRRDNPELKSWGAEVFGSDGTVLPDGTVLDAVDGHNLIGGSEAGDANKYIGPNTESLANVLNILSDRLELLTPGSRPSE
ncbi:alpha/beta hydrolase [Plantibacter sp. Mn2098]|uniref:alpha/beta hydrolase n=1 Tax=Plantibacter sp. Mn2098 TaxID=3395266 RepID=UPI003BD15B45